METQCRELFEIMEHMNLSFTHKNYILDKLKLVITSFLLLYQHNIICLPVFLIKVKTVKMFIIF